MTSKRHHQASESAGNDSTKTVVRWWHVSIYSTIGVMVLLSSISFGISRYVIEQAKPDKEETYRLANLNYDKGDFVTAAGLYQRYLDKFDSENVAMRIDYGYALFSSGKQFEGIEVTKSVLIAHPEQASAMYNIGVMYANQGNFSEAMRWLKKCASSTTYPDIAAQAQDIINKVSANQ
ncbi:MAG: tetratricopeptide repeat protein [Ignavibacteria bacterium]|nr:tetratricopeptide repeat protein [Ignavibacteria bacterium]